jgi:hypothetical protein
MPLLEPVPEILTAIEQTRMLRLMYHGKERILEPHDHGILNGSVQLLGYQIAGKSSRRLPNWLRMRTDEVVNLEVLDQTFPGGRPTAAGNHTRWANFSFALDPPDGSTPAPPDRVVATCHILTTVLPARLPHYYFG